MIISQQTAREKTEKDMQQMCQDSQRQNLEMKKEFQKKIDDLQREMAK